MPIPLDNFPFLLDYLHKFAETELFKAAWGFGPLTLFLFIVINAAIFLMPAFIAKFLSVILKKI